MTERRGNGYYGYSMSNNAVSAYADGEMPLSKWTKSVLVDTVEAANDNIKVAGLTLSELRAKFLVYSSYHHILIGICATK